MGTLGIEVLESARQKIGEPFRHHFKPTNMCEGGRLTVDNCMERGMDSTGYDCSGLAIASLCEVLHLELSQWPRDLRHAQQIAELAVDDEPQPGDLRLYYSSKGRIHIGIATESAEAIHANGLTNVVKESVVVDPSGAFEAVRAVAVDGLYRAIFASKRN